MSYSQKYCLVSFIQPVDIGTEFNMADWPLHITLADVFTIDRDSTNIESKLAELLSGHPSVNTLTKEEAILGTTAVVLLDKTKELVSLHTSLVDLLEKNDAIFNSPEFTREGFLPHCTIQQVAQLYARGSVTISTVALIDMFPNQNWQQRKVISTFKLQFEHT